MTYPALPDGLQTGISGSTSPTPKKPKRPSGSSTNLRRSLSPPPPSPPPRYNPPAPPPPAPIQSGPVQSVTPPKPKPPNIKDFLAGDEVYQQTLRGGQRSLQDFLSELTRRRGESETGFAQAQEAMERDKEQQLARLQEEFASRGLIHSGLFGQEQGRFQEAFQQQFQNMEQQQQALLADILAQETNFRREQELAMELARQEALARRAQRFNIPL